MTARQAGTRRRMVHRRRRRRYLIPATFFSAAFHRRWGDAVEAVDQRLAVGGGHQLGLPPYRAQIWSKPRLPLNCLPRLVARASRRAANRS